MDQRNQRIDFKASVPKIQHKCLFLLAVCFLLFYNCGSNHGADNHFDYLIFSQRWLPSSCIAFEEKNSSSKPNHCSLPQNYQLWAIHGLWPTQYHNKMGPFFCNKTDKFHVNVLDPIIEDLKKYWPNIEAGHSLKSLWQHEWIKHGTCAEQLDFLNSEIKYFNATLNLYWKHNITDLFISNNILALNNVGYSVLDIIEVIEKSYGKRPYISCIEEVKTKQPYLSEVRICYDKNLTLIDCDEPFSSRFNYSSNKITNCPINSKLIFPDVVQNLNKNFDYKKLETMRSYKKLHILLEAVEFLKWASL